MNFFLEPLQEDPAKYICEVCQLEEKEEREDWEFSMEYGEDPQNLLDWVDHH